MARSSRKRPPSRPPLPVYIYPPEPRPIDPGPLAFLCDRSPLCNALLRVMNVTDGTWAGGLIAWATLGAVVAFEAGCIDREELRHQFERVAAGFVGGC